MTELKFFHTTEFAVAPDKYELELLHNTNIESS